jgi:hypothetical protein
MEAARLKALGWSLPEIADHLGLGGDPRRAGAAIRRALANTVRVARDEQRLLELQSLDELERACWIELRARHILVSNGRIVRDEMDVALEDDRFVLETIDRILKIKEHRGKLLGLNAPTRSEVLTIDSVDAEITKLEQELRSLDAPVPQRVRHADDSAGSLKAAGAFCRVPTAAWYRPSPCSAWYLSPRSRSVSSWVVRFAGRTASRR